MKKGFSHIESLVVLAVLAILAGGVWVWTQSQPAMESVPSPTPTPIMSPVITSTPIITPIPNAKASPTITSIMGWKSFSDKELKISFNYPADWGVRGSSPSLPFINIYPPNGKNFYEQIAIVSALNYFSSHADLSIDQAFKLWIDSSRTNLLYDNTLDRSGKPNIITESTTEINGIKMITLKADNRAQEYATNKIVYYSRILNVFSSPDHKNVFYISYADSGIPNLETINQILSTFRFD